MRLSNSGMGGFFHEYFIIEINDELNMDDFESNSNEQKGTFMHEYCHFLQGITTLYGFNCFISGLDNLYCKLHKQSFSEKVTYLEQKYMQFFGDKELDNEISVNGAVIINQIYMTEETLSGMDECSHIKIKCYGYRDYDFGNLCIAESMAYLLERCLYKVTKRTDQFPYNAVEEVAKYVYADFEFSICQLIAMCEYALQFENGGLVIYQLLKKMSEERFAPDSVDELVKYMNGNYDVSFNWDLITLKNLLDEVYPDNNEWNKVKEWIYQAFEYGMRLRETHGCFLAYILERNRDITFLFLNNLLADIGLPPIGFKNEIMYWNSGDREIDLSYLLAPFVIYKYDEKECLLTDKCYLKDKYMCLNKRDFSRAGKCSVYEYFLWFTEKKCCSNIDIS